MVEFLAGIVKGTLLETNAPLGGHEDWRGILQSMEIPTSVSTNRVLSEALNSLIHGGRISREQALEIYDQPDINAIFALANLVKRSRFDNQIFFNQNLHINTTNICVLACRFCAFRKGPRHSDA